MKCEDHPFYPRRYCWGCKYKRQECAICGDSQSTSIKFEMAVQIRKKHSCINICEKCYQRVMSIKEGQIVDSYNKTFAFRLIKNKQSRKLIKLEEH